MAIDPKEVVLAILGASAGLAGFVLVFLGRGAFNFANAFSTV